MRSIGSQRVGKYAAGMRPGIDSEIPETFRALQKRHGAEKQKESGRNANADFDDTFSGAVLGGAAGDRGGVRRGVLLRAHPARPCAESPAGDCARSSPGGKTAGGLRRTCSGRLKPFPKLFIRIPAHPIPAGKSGESLEGISEYTPSTGWAGTFLPPVTPVFYTDEQTPFPPGRHASATGRAARPASMPPLSQPLLSKNF